MSQWVWYSIELACSSRSDSRALEKNSGRNYVQLNSLSTYRRVLLSERLEQARIELKNKTFPGVACSVPPTTLPLEAYALGDHLGHRSVFILHPRMFIVGYENRGGGGGEGGTELLMAVSLLNYIT